MGFWLVVILWAVTFAVSQLLTPKPEFEDAKAATLDEFNFPTATEGRMMPLGWGTDKIAGPNVLWYGDLRTSAITQKVKSGLFNSKRVVVGHRYSPVASPGGFPSCHGGRRPVSPPGAVRSAPLASTGGSGQILDP